MSTPNLVLLAAPALTLLATGNDRVHWLLPVALLVTLLVLGELWLRALTAEAVAAPCRIGLGAVAGLITLPLVALALQVLDLPIRARSIALGLAAVAVLLAVVVLVRERSGRVPADPRFARTAAAVGIPLVLAVVVGGAATVAYVRLPHPPEPGFTSVALGGWAARIDRPVDIPRRGLAVPIRVTSANTPATVAPLWIQVGDRVGRQRPVALPVDGTRSIDVHVPAPPDDCLHRIEINLGGASTVFYGRGPYDPRRTAEC